MPFISKWRVMARTPRAFLKNLCEPALHLGKKSYYDNDFVIAESGALETRRKEIYDWFWTRYKTRRF